MSRRRSARIALATLLSASALFAGAVVSRSQDPPPEAPPVAQGAEPARPTTPFALDIAAVMEDEAARLRVLEARFLAAADAEAALAAEREIAAVKMGTELRLMEVQARHARAAGLLEEAERIEAAIAEAEAAAASPAARTESEASAQPRERPPAGGGPR